MKNIKFIFLLLTITVIACAKNPYEVEDVLYQCMVDKYAEKNVDLDVELEKFETYLIEEHILESKSGDAYFDLYSDMTRFPPLDINIYGYNFENLNAIEAYELISDNCLAHIDSSIIKKSKVYTLDKETVRYYTHQETTEFNSIFEVYQSVIGPEEYEHFFYKLRVLFMVRYTADIEGGIPLTMPVELPSDKNTLVKCNESKKLIIEVDSLEQITVLKKIIELGELKSLLREFLINNAPKYIIELYADKETPYDVIFEIIALKKQLIGGLEDEKSMELYNMSFDKLDTDSRDFVKGFYPNTIDLKYR